VETYVVVKISGPAVKVVMYVCVVVIWAVVVIVAVYVVPRVESITVVTTSEGTVMVDVNVLVESAVRLLVKVLVTVRLYGLNVVVMVLGLGVTVETSWLMYVVVYVDAGELIVDK
jgi:hypothetical protein